MFKLRIVHKGLILVAVPVLFGTVFITLLLFGLIDSNRLIERSLRLKDAMVWQIVQSENFVTAEGCYHCYKLTRDPFFKEHYKSSSQKERLATDKLDKLLSDPKVILPEQVQAVRAAASFSLNSMTTGRSQLLQKMSQEESKKALAATNSLKMLLYGGMISSVVVSGILAIFFCLNIRNRLLIILSNTVSLSKGTSSNPPLNGSDEIAELDQFLYKSASEIRTLERFKREMIGVVSHELKSPLSSVAGFLSSLSAGVFGEISAKAKDKVERTHKSVNRLMLLIKDLLILDRLELELKLEEVSVEEIVTASVDAVKELSDLSEIEIVIKSDAGNVCVDRNRIVQVVVNLLSNAIKFSPPASEVSLEARIADGSFECRVSDQGRGIPEAMRKQIFEPFRQVDAKDFVEKKGTGLGLTISHSIVEQHGGTIGVDSAAGEGSTFWFKIPSARDNPKTMLPATQLKGGAELSRTVALRSGQRFGVLQQGLLMIALPLTFQLVFVSVIWNQLNEIQIQTKREEESKEIIDYLCKGIDILLRSNKVLLTYVFTSAPGPRHEWEKRRDAGLAFLDQAISISASDSKRQKVLKQAKAFIWDYNNLVEREAIVGDKTNFYRKLAATGVLEVIIGSGANASLDKLAELIPEDEGMSKFEVMQQIHKKAVTLVLESKPLYRFQTMIEQVITKEVVVAARLSEQRSRMIEILELTLCAGIVLNIGLSVALAFTLMRSLTSRLAHVMENTARLVKREELEAPEKGADEIADLDRIMCETARHLYELETFKRELVAIVSHELRTPLLSVSSALELFESGALGDLSEKGKLRLKFAQNEAARLIRLINDLLDIEKMDAGKFVLDKAEYKVSDLVSNSIAAIAQLAEVKGLKLESELSNPDEIIYADKDRLCQVLINLLSNAIKYSPDNGIIRIVVEKSNDEITFSVIDRGRGIPAELRERIFERFVQVEKSDESERGGSGLGLAISKSIVEQHGGSIAVESEMGSGSKFYFKLPLKR